MIDVICCLAAQEIQGLYALRCQALDKTNENDINVRWIKSINVYIVA